jgi:hypothetical protein
MIKIWVEFNFTTLEKCVDNVSFAGKKTRLQAVLAV